jgi:hypothetical protein
MGQQQHAPTKNFPRQKFARLHSKNFSEQVEIEMLMEGGEGEATFWAMVSANWGLCRLSFLPVLCSNGAEKGGGDMENRWEMEENGQGGKRPRLFAGIGTLFVWLQNGHIFAI